MATAPPAGGSQYENYDSTSSTYDIGRQVVGLEVILGGLAGSGSQQKQLNKFRVLDAGCGTGNFVVALSPYVGQVHGLDYSKGMVAKAKEKTQHLTNVELQEGDITSIPFLDDYFDGIIINQVLHHLTLPGPDFSQVEKFFQEAHRVLVPNGAIIVNVSSVIQYHTLWFYHIVPEARDNITTRVPSVDYCTSILTKTGFNLRGIYAVIDPPLINPAVYLQKEGPFDKNWRNMDSVWSLARPSELESDLKQWKEQIENGEADKIIAKSEEERKTVGNSTSIVAYKHC